MDSYGFLPLSANSVPGFSIEEHVSPDAWFSGEEGVWEWKGPVIRDTGYGNGELSLLLADAVGNDGRVDSVDINKEAIAAAQEKKKESGKTNVSFSVAYISQLTAGKYTVSAHKNPCEMNRSDIGRITNNV